MADLPHTRKGLQIIVNGFLECTVILTRVSKDTNGLSWNIGGYDWFNSGWETQPHSLMVQHGLPLEAAGKARAGSDGGMIMETTSLPFKV